MEGVCLFIYIYMDFYSVYFKIIFKLSSQKKTIFTMNPTPSNPVVSASSCTYCSNRNNIIVVYGEGHKQEDCILTAPGAQTGLMVSTNTICIIKRGALIRNSGVLRLDYEAALMRLEEGASIDVGLNGRLIIDGMLIMERGARLVVEPDACLFVRGAVCVSNAATLTIACGNKCDMWHHATIPAPLLLTVDTSREFCAYSRKKTVTWCEDDRRFLEQLMLFFCGDHRLPSEIIYPILLQTVCRRYGVLMLPNPYILGPRTLPFGERVNII